MLYLIKSGDYIKIGYSSNLEQRFRTYNTCNPNYELLDIVDGEEADEKDWHERLLIFKYKLEWFRYDPRIIQMWNDKYSKTISVQEESKSSKNTEVNYDYEALLYRENFILHNIKNLIDSGKSCYDYLTKKLEESDNNKYIQIIRNKDLLIKHLQQVVKDLAEILGMEYSIKDIN